MKFLTTNDVTKIELCLAFKSIIESQQSNTTELKEDTRPSSQVAAQQVYMFCN